MGGRAIPRPWPPSARTGRAGLTCARSPRLPEQSLGSKQQHENEDAEYEQQLESRGDQGPQNALKETDGEASDQGAVHTAKSAQHDAGKGNEEERVADC